MENPSNAKRKNHGHQPATISLSQEFWVTRLWWLTRESSLHKTLARVYVPYRGGLRPPAPPVSATLRPSLRLLWASASLRQKPGLYHGVNLEQLQHQQHLLYPANSLRIAFLILKYVPKSIFINTSAGINLSLCRQGTIAQKWVWLIFPIVQSMAVVILHGYLNAFVLTSHTGTFIKPPLPGNHTHHREREEGTAGP
jgi:hypothetical protein